MGIPLFFFFNCGRFGANSSSEMRIMKKSLPMRCLAGGILLGIAFGLIPASGAFAQDAPITRDEKGELTKEQLNQIIEQKKNAKEGPYQILLQVIIFEVFLRNEDKIGFLYDILGEVGEFRGTNLAGDPVVESDLSVLGSGNRNELLPAGANIVTNIFEGDEGRVEAIFQALAEDQKVTVHANPNLLTLEGVPARLENVEDVPFLERQVVGESETFTTEFRNTGVSLEMTPTVEFGEMDVLRERPFIWLDVTANLSNVSRYREEEGFTQPILDSRNYHSRLCVRADQRVIIGSHYRDQQTNQMRGIPILKDIPVMGRLFKGTSDTNRISQLYVIIKPTLLDLYGQPVAGESAGDPELDAKKIRELLDERSKEINTKTSPFENFRELFIDRTSPQ